MKQTELNDLLGAVQKRAAIVRDSVRQVALGMANSFFLFGPGGHGKSHAVHQELDSSIGIKKWVLHNSHITAASLCDSLFINSESVHVFEDCELLYKDKMAAGILRSALAAPKNKPRMVTYETACKKICFEFKGGIIIVSNESLKTHGIIGAIASRMKPIEWRLSSLEMTAIILQTAKSGDKRHNLKPNQCCEIAEFLVQEMDASKQFDLRTYFDHALPCFALWYAEKSDAHWHDVLKAKIQGHVRGYETRSQVRQREQIVALQCRKECKSLAEQLAMWKEKTGKSRQAFYDRLKESA